MSANEKNPYDKPQVEPEHSDPSVHRDLNPDYMQGQNVGVQRTSEQPGARYASEVKELTRALDDFTQDELQQIPVIVEGARLQQGATYVDLADDERKPFTATGEMVSGPNNWLVPKAEVPYPFWNRLVGVQSDYRRE